MNMKFDFDARAIHSMTLFEAFPTLEGQPFLDALRDRLETMIPTGYYDPKVVDVKKGSSPHTSVRASH